MLASKLNRFWTDRINHDSSSLRPDDNALELRAFTYWLDEIVWPPSDIADRLEIMIDRLQLGTEFERVAGYFTGLLAKISNQ